MRLHVHIGTDDITRSRVFYTALFGEPNVVHGDYLRWEPDTLPVTIAVSTRAPAGVDHIGLKGEAGEIAPYLERLARNGFTGALQANAACCYAVGDKTWAVDPSGVPVELYEGGGTIEVFGTDRRPNPSAVCCQPGSSPEQETLPLVAVPAAVVNFLNE